MLTGLKILIFSMLLGGRTHTSPDPYMNFKMDFLGFFGGNKYCYMRDAWMGKEGDGKRLRILEFIIKDFDGRLISREIIYKEEDYLDINKRIIKKEYLGKTDIYGFLKKNNVQKNYSPFHALYLKNNYLYSNASKYNKQKNKYELDSVSVLSSDKVRSLIAQYNQEQIFVEAYKWTWNVDSKVGEMEKNVLCSRIEEIYQYKDKYLLIIQGGDDGHDYEQDEFIILIDASILDKIFKR
jgi:hypothetical protein